MTRAGRTRAGLFAVLMLVIALAGTALVSAGAEHHRAHSHDHAVAAFASEPTESVDSTHEHQHGGEWTSVPNSRLRPAANVTVRCTLPTDGHALVAVDLVGPPGGDCRDDQASNPVLRV
ncbi:hypothetical protein KOI35_23785 [Actinoplanes bogorensis]|uniref:Secreted protein n=1 Tax=Paractinoplanes bogorensis TaxID=1610840 RepID=A0ABS5YT47_9ACTN|nr:hypothetical protein [Actinoplanes bogorensis]MBU2666533.1 hypothetical protein [Actinoplanes bogorensis]